MNKPLNALILDDSKSDAELLLYELQSGGFSVNYLVVDNAEDMKRALAEHSWEIILSDYSMPSFTAIDALKIMQDEGLDLPFIVISGTVGEDTAVTVMKAGANDFFVKGHLKRIVPSVERELREASERRKRGEAEARFSTVFHRSSIGTVITRLSDGAVLDVNQRFLELFNFSRDALIGKSGAVFETLFNPESSECITRLLRDTGSVQGIEVEYENTTGTGGFALFSAEIIELDHEKCILSMVQDITDRKNAEQMLRTSEEKYRLLAENSTDMISRYTPEGDYLYVSPSCQTLLGYSPEELVGHSAYEFIHADDLDIVAQAHQDLLKLPTTYTVIYRMRRKDGVDIWFETSSRTIRDSATDKVLEIQSASRDISIRKAAEDARKLYADRLELLHHIDTAILRGDQIEVTVTSVLTRLQALIGFDSASITTFDSDFRDFTVLASIAHIPDYYPYDDVAVIEHLKNGEIYLVNDLLSLQQPSASDEALLRNNFRSYVRVPLIVSEKLVGSLHLRGIQANAFTPEGIAIAREVGAQLAIAIENARLREIEQRRISELSALHQASLQLTSTLDVEYVLDTILDYALLLIQADDGHLFLYDGENLTFGSALWQGQKRDAPYAQPRPHGLTHTVARTGERIIISDVNQHPIYADWKWGGAIIGLPLRMGSNVEQRVLKRTSELQASEAKYRALIEFAPDPVVIFDTNDHITLVNRRAEETFGYERQELIGHPVEMLLPEQLSDIDVVHRVDKLIEPAHRANLELVARHKNGTEIPVKIGLSPINAGDETLIMAYIVDITADKQLEESLRTALAKEKELNELRTSFTSIVSHEFRTPLSVILSSAELLIKYGDRMDTIRRAEKLENITRQVGRLIKLMDDVLTITQSEGIGFVYKPSLINLVALSEQILEDVRTGYPQQVQLELSTSGDCHEVMADEFLFSHILQNLTTNAIKYSRSNGIVRIMLACTESVLTLRVEDQGIGIPQQDQSRLFEAFQRAANVGQIQGTGIGLTIVKRAVDACGGRIEFESTEGVGTTFVVTLPVEKPTGRAQELLW
jgi:PAS domain S-box-containing protein